MCLSDLSAVVFFFHPVQGGDNSVVECQTCNRKVTGMIPGRRIACGLSEFFSACMKDELCRFYCMLCEA